MEKRYELFTTLVIQLNRQIQRIKSAEMAELGLKSTHATCLFLLDQAPQGMTQADLVRLCCQDKATVSRAVSILVERGLVQTCQQSKSLLYNALIRLTDTGREVARKVSEKVERAVTAGGDSLSQQDRSRLYVCLQQICANLNTYIDENF